MNIQEAEQILSETIIKSWERLRSSDEIQSFIGRRELALATVDSSEFDDLL